MEMETVFDANTASVLLTIPRFNEILRVSIEQALNFVQINRALSRNDDSSDEEAVPIDFCQTSRLTSRLKFAP